MKLDMLRSIGKQSRESVELVLEKKKKKKKKKKKAAVGTISRKLQTWRWKLKRNKMDINNMRINPLVFNFCNLNTVVTRSRPFCDEFNVSTIKCFVGSLRFKRPRTAPCWCRPLAVQQSIDIACSPGPQQQTRRGGVRRRDRTDTWTDAHAGSANRKQLTC